MNTLITLIFFLIAALILGSAIMVVTVQNIVHAALWLIAAFFGVGALYLLMEAEFVAVSQVLIYVGAVSILILFAIMLTRDVSDAGIRRAAPLRWWGTLVICGALFGLLLVPTVSNYVWQPVPTIATQPLASSVQIGTAFMREYLLPFEVASVLLLVALVGAIVIAFEERSARRRIPTLAEEWARTRGQGTGDRGQGTGDRGQGTGDRGQESEAMAEAVQLHTDSSILTPDS